MSGELAEVLSGINDPATIQKILSTTKIKDISNSNLPSSSEPPSLGELFDRFLDRRKNRSPSTKAQYKRTIPIFVNFAETKGVTSPISIEVETVEAFVDKLQAKHDADATILTYTKNVRTWLKWISQRDLCEESVYKILDQNKLGLSPKARDEALSVKRARAILVDLRKKRRGSPQHTVIELLWNGGPRIGGAHSTDLRDFDPERSELKFRHRPQSGTRLKNGSERDDTPGDGERNIALKEEVVEAIKLYVQRERPSVTDEYGRKPLFATKYGRASRSTIRRWVYEATSCRWGRPDSEIIKCDGSCDPDANICHYSYYPHAIRRGAIVNHLSNGLRPDRASERFDVSTEIIRKHYDPRTKHERKEDRAEAVRNAW